LADITIVGAGAAGLATAIFLGRAHPHHSVRLLEGARKPGAKILVSGGTRCNVTNRVVSERDFWGGRQTTVRRVLQAFSADAAVEFFSELGVPLHEEAGGKLFPDSGRARDVLNALLRGVDACGTQLQTDHRVLSVTRIPGRDGRYGRDGRDGCDGRDGRDAGFRVETSRGMINSEYIVLATGGLSLPKTGSDGAGLGFAAHLGHAIVTTTPALTPLVLDGASPDAIHRSLSGVSHDAELAVWIDGRVATRIRGSLLWTHLGISGPVALNASRHWLRAEVEGRPVRMTISFRPGATFETEDAVWTTTAAARPKTSVLTALSSHVPASVAAAILERLAIDPARQLARLTRSARRQLVAALVESPLPVTGSRGYQVAEATAGGVSLDDIDPSTMESRRERGLFLVGEMLDVDGRIGGFNFQWAWSTAYVAARALAARTRSA
jgi:predicted flavoprotein YhiN